MNPIKVDFLDNYNDRLKKYQDNDTNVNFLIFLTTFQHDLGDYFFEFKVVRSKIGFSFSVIKIKSSEDFSCHYEDVQTTDFTTLEKLIVNVKQNNVVIWKH